MWQNLSRIQKIFFVVLVSLAVPFAPELIFIADLGGIELVFSFLVLYYKPLLLKIQLLYNKAKSKALLCSTAFKSSALYQPKVFSVQAVFSCATLLLTGSVLYASIFFMPALMLNGVLV